ncbi:MAG: hypothetical protein IPG07_07060 [Crocinitomicaceae bacterium]|jgi:hypothetical protein|nr:hypothetical protein [Crocinitomicaceae bacterium]
MRFLFSNIRLRHLAVFILLISSHVSNAQNKEAVKFLVDNENGYFEILLDDTLLIKRYKDSLTVGQHKAQVWSYGYDVKEVEFTVEPGKTTEVYVKLDRSAAFGAYESSYAAYRVKFHKAVTIPISTSLALSLTSGAFMINAYNLRKTVLVDINNYSQTTIPDEIALIKNRVEENNRKYNISRTGFYIAGGLALAGIGTSIYTALKFKRSNPVPVYSKQSPFSDKMSLQFTGTGFVFQIKIG